MTINLADQQPRARVVRDNLDLALGDLHILVVDQLTIQRLKDVSVLGPCSSNNRIHDGHRGLNTDLILTGRCYAAL